MALFFLQKAVIHCSALTLPCTWGCQQQRAGRQLLFRGDKSTQRDLARLDLHEHLGIAYQKEGCAPGMSVAGVDEKQRWCQLWLQTYLDLGGTSRERGPFGRRVHLPDSTRVTVTIEREAQVEEEVSPEELES